MATTGRNVKDELNRCMPAAKHANLGDMLELIINNQNALITNQKALAAKLDAIGAAGNAGDIATAAGITNVSGLVAMTAGTPPSKL